MLTLSIDVTKIDKTKLVPGKKARADGTTAKYMELIVIDRKDDYGNTHMVAQGVSKADRDAGIKGAILGNGRERGKPFAGNPTKPQPARKAPADPDLDVEADDIPF